MSESIRTLATLWIESLVNLLNFRVGRNAFKIDFEYKVPIAVSRAPHRHLYAGAAVYYYWFSRYSLRFIAFSNVST